MSHRCISRMAACAALCILTQAAGANITIYNNFGPDHNGWDYNYGTGWTIAGEENATQYGVEQAFLFTATASGPLSDIWLPIWKVPSDPGYDEVVVKLTTNPNNAPPTDADVLEQWVLTEFPGWSSWAEPHHLVGSGSSYLEEGQSYWIWTAVTPNAPLTWCGWCLNIEPSFTAPHTLRREGQSWLGISNETASAFRVDIVPEPATGFLALLLAGLIRRR